jgi:hypothetical protein
MTAFYNNNLGDQLYNTTFSIFQKVQAMYIKTLHQRLLQWKYILICEIMFTYETSIFPLCPLATVLFL